MVIAPETVLEIVEMSVLRRVRVHVVRVQEHVKELVAVVVGPHVKQDVHRVHIHVLDIVSRVVLMIVLAVRVDVIMAGVVPLVICGVLRKVNLLIDEKESFKLGKFPSLKDSFW